VRGDANIDRVCVVCEQPYERVTVGRNNVCSNVCRLKRRNILRNHSIIEVAYIATCGVCRDPFRVYDNVTVACSTKCLRFIRQREASTRQCKRCNVTFSLVNPRCRYVTCSRKCQTLRNQVKAAKRKKPHVRVERTCVECGAKFKAYDSQSKTCGAVCREQRKGRQNREGKAKRK